MERDRAGCADRALLGVHEPDGLIIEWWQQGGGTAVSFGSGVHDPHFLAQGFADAVEVVAANGYRPGSHPGGFWMLD